MPKLKFPQYKVRGKYRDYYVVAFPIIYSGIIIRLENYLIYAIFYWKKLYNIWKCFSPKIN